MKTDSDTDELGADWKAFLESHPGVKRDELPLAGIATGDRILIKTRNTRYLFTWKGGDLAELRASNPKAPSGEVRIMGCSFGLSSSIRPDALFCGGNLEFTHANGEKTWTTSELQEIHLLHKSPPDLESAP
ncbi:MAG: hypothetical protein WDO13_15460 [Verrucomicrobiota bacterium]